MHRAPLAFLLALSLVGLADSWYLFQSAITDTALVCDIGAVLDGCNIVAQSPYSSVYGVPLAFFGVVFYALIAILAACTLRYPRHFLFRLLYVLTALSVLASIVFVSIQVFLIKALCVYCLLSAAISVLVFLFARALVRGHSKAQNPGS